MEERFVGLLDGRYNRDEVDRWAAQWVAAPGDAGIHDDRVWQALSLLFGIDARHGPDGAYLHDDEQIRDWLSELRR